MIGRLIPLRLLRASSAFRCPRGCGAAPSLFRSEASSCTANPFRLGGDCAGGRFFSSLSRRPRSGPGGGPPRSGRNVEVRSRGAAAGQAKSLIEDEEELSDWISDMKKDSFRLGLSRDGDEDSDHSRPKGGRGRTGGRDSDNFNSGGRKGVSFDSRSKASTSRRMNDDSDDFADFSNRGMSRSPRGSSSKRISTRRQMDDDSNDFSEPFRRGMPQGSRVSSSKGTSRRRQMDDDLEDDPLDLSDRLINSRTSPRYSSKKRFENESEDDYDDFEDDDELGTSSNKKKSVGARDGTVAKSARKGRKDIETGMKSGKGAAFPLTFPDDQEVEQDEDEDDSDFDDDFFGDEGNDKEKSFQNAFKSFGSRESNKGDGEQQALTNETGEDNSYLSQTRFVDCSISPLTLQGIKSAGYERMTVVQEATLPVILKGKDVLAKAKTGTGKTVAFLLPAIEVVSKLPPVDRDNKRPPINVLVVCPTRELADQAAVEANKLVKYHPSLGVQVVMGGTRLAVEQKKLQSNHCQILVATPGRLRDHIENTPGFATRLMGVKFLVLDEADRLLDMGFRKDIEKIVAAVPKQRQTLLFSATVPDEVREICYMAMKRDLEFINTVEEGAEETHSQVKQMHLVAPLEKQFSLLYKMLSDHICDNVDYKVIVFCTTAMVTRFVAELLSELKLNVREIHSRKPQSYRTRVSKEFKESKGLILVSSDVSARGVDYPNVTLVIQLGVPADREQYIHRLGRTGRKGKEGMGILMLAPWEESFLGSIKDLPITKAPSIQIDPDITKKVQRGLGHVELKNKESAYQAWLGYYNSNKHVGRDKYQLVSLANEFSRSMGLDNPPAISTVVLRKMGLNNVPGLRAK